MKSQKDIFLQSEADKWYERNREAILHDHKDRNYLAPVFDYLDKDNLNILEIGASVGHNLNYIKNKSTRTFNLFAIEPSRKAVEDGEKIYPNIKFCQGTADDLHGYDEALFDVILVGFCMYLVDRHSLSSIVCEIDRILKPNGKLVIFDFDVKYPRSNQYIHCEGIQTYKMDYSKLFLSLPNYFLVSKKSWSHFGDSFHDDKNERCSTFVLHKEIHSN